MPNTIKHIKLALVIPCYDEERPIEACVRRVLEIQSSSDLRLEMIIVNDSSRDRSYEIAYSLVGAHPHIRLLRHEVNRGKGAALRTSFQAATGD